jgi:hypothetical protein
MEKGATLHGLGFLKRMRWWGGTEGRSGFILVGESGLLVRKEAGSQRFVEVLGIAGFGIGT